MDHMPHLLRNIPKDTAFSSSDYFEIKFLILIQHLQWEKKIRDESLIQPPSGRDPHDRATMNANGHLQASNLH